MTIATTEEIIEDIRLGRMVVLVDAEDRENEGDLIFAADHVTPEKINFMATHGRGLVCMPITVEHARALHLAPMATHNRTVHGTNFTVAIEAASGVSTGISAADRAHTIRVATRPQARPADIVQPGHVFPLVAQPGGVLMRAGHTEATCDFARLAGLNPAGVLCEIMNADGTMARMPDLVPFAERHGLKIGTIADLIRYRSMTETLIEKISERTVSTPYGDFRLHAFREKTTGEVHLALTRGEITPDRAVLTRVHEPFTSLDLFDFDNGQHAYSVAEAMRIIATEGSGVLVLLRRHESADAILARVLPQGDEPAGGKWDPRMHGVGAQILRKLNVQRMRVLAHAKRMPSMAGFDLEVVEFIPPGGERKLKAV
ncbi:MAG TPA: bifunctional 3,4-dihydroxy-2-butanone-4-phosphate synthase/GTP cyclohydrolase II [Usitatibacteraceae bacterium]|nr:bifunctional 3,4-dihydroxy-2-butanone-4-phosphate synthase/GTP cyclohydrolase II [Usitatibacteraceae bacterium]